MQRFWVAIPAAGIGTRMASEVPKQYLQLLGRTVIEHALSCFFDHPRLAGIVVALGANDCYWPRLSFSLPVGVSLHTTLGGGERCHSVLNALTALGSTASEDDWVLVHDAARPCLRREDLNALVSRLSTHDIGGLLALPVRDTLKRAGIDGEVAATVDRKHLWQALTPQMFRLGMLRSALESSLVQHQVVTDESQAMELAGYRPVLIEGHEDNIKITRPQDLELAELFLRTRGTK